MSHEFKVGDRVRVVSIRPPENYKVGWNPLMDATLGKEGQIIDHNTARGWYRVEFGNNHQWSYLPEWLIPINQAPSEPKPLFHPGDRVRVKQELKSPPRFKLRLSVRPTHLCKVGQTITIDKYDSSDDTYQERGSGLWWASEWLEPIEVKSDSADAGSRPQSLDESRVMSRTRAELEICCTHVPGVDTASRTPLINPTQLLTINNLG